MLLEACPAGRICGGIVEVKPKLSPLWYIWTSLAGCSQTLARKWKTHTHTHTHTHTSTLFFFFLHSVQEWYSEGSGRCMNPELVILPHAMTSVWQRAESLWPLRGGHAWVTPCHCHVTQMPGISAMFPDTLPTDLTSCIHMSFPPAHSCGRKRGDGGPSHQGSLTPISLPLSLVLSHSVSSTFLHL